MKAFTPEELQQQLKQLSQWKVENGELTRTFQFDSFVGALNFVSRVGEIAERMGHHPDIDIRYNRVRLGLTTHDAGGITEKDADLAGRTDMLGMGR